MKKIKKILIVGMTTVILGMNFLSSGIVESLPKKQVSNYIQAYKHNPDNILENVFENNGLTILPFIFENSDQHITKDYVIKQFKNAGLKVENEKELKNILVTGDKIKTESKTYTVLIYGDVNKDGIVDTFDAYDIMKHYVHGGKYTLTGINLIAANVENNDNEVDTFDAYRIMRFYVGFETKLVVKEPEGSKIPDEPKKEKPEYTVPTGLKATYGETLADVKLPEGFTFEDDLTTKVGNVGTNKFKVTYTPKDTDKYEIVTGIEVEIVVTKPDEPEKEKPEYTVPTGLKATYGETLADVKLPEGFTFEDKLTTKVGNAGTNTFKVTYIPEDTDKYQIVTGIEVEIEVEKAKLTEGKDYTVPTNLKATYGDKLKDVTGTGLTAQWKFIKEDGTDASEEFVGNANAEGNEFTLQFIPEDGVENYEEVIVAVKVVVEKAEPDAPVLRTLRKAKGTLLKDIDLPEGWAFVDKSETATVGDTVNLDGKEFAVTYTPSDTDNYKTKDAKILIIVVAGKLVEGVDYTVPTNLKATYGDKLKDVTGTGLTAQWKFIKEDGTDASEEFVGNANAEGNEFTLQFIPEDGVENYEDVTVTVKVVVEKAEPQNMPGLTTLTKVQGTLLKDIDLPEGWAFADKSETATVGEPNAEGNEIPVIYTSPITPENYKTKDGVIKIIVIKPLQTVTANIPNKKDYYYCDDKVTIEVKSGENEEQIDNSINLAWTVIKTDAEANENNDYTNKAHRVIGSDHGTIQIELILDKAGTYEFTPIIEGASSTSVNITVKDNPVVKEVIFKEEVEKVNAGGEAVKELQEITEVSIRAQKEKAINIEFKNTMDKYINVDASRIVNLLKINGTSIQPKTENGVLVLEADGIKIELMTKTGEIYTKITDVNSKDNVDRIKIMPTTYIEGNSEKTLTVEVKNTELGIEGATNKEGTITIKVLEEMPQVVRVTKNPEDVQPTAINLYLGNSLANIKEGDRVEVGTDGKLYTILPIYLYDGEKDTVLARNLTALVDKESEGEIHIVDNQLEDEDIGMPCIKFQRYYSADGGKTFKALDENGRLIQDETDEEIKPVNYIGIAIDKESRKDLLEYVHIYNDAMTTEDTGANTDKIKLNVTVIL